MELFKFQKGHIYKEFKQLCTHFIWDNKPSKVAYDSLILPTEKGGLGLMDLGAKVSAAKGYITLKGYMSLKTSPGLRLLVHFSI